MRCGMPDKLGSRLRQVREGQGIALAIIASDTKIGLSLLEGLERDDVSHWPSGIFRRSFIRAYAQAIGLDPDPIVAEFLEQFPDLSKPLPQRPSFRRAPPLHRHGSEPRPAGRSLEGGRPLSRGVESPDRGPAALGCCQHPRRPFDCGARLALAVVRFDANSQLRASMCSGRPWNLPKHRSPDCQRPKPALVIKVRIASNQSSFARGKVIGDLRCRWAAAACDAGMLMFVAVAMFLILNISGPHSEFPPSVTTSPAWSSWETPLAFACVPRSIERGVASARSSRCLERSLRGRRSPAGETRTHTTLLCRRRAPLACGTRARSRLLANYCDSDFRS